MNENELTFPDQNRAFQAQADNLERRRKLARSLIEHGMRGNTGSGYQGGKVFIVGNPIGNIASSLAGNYLDSQVAGEQEQLQRQEQQAAAQQLASIPSAGPERQQEQLRALQNPSLRQTIAAQMGLDKDEQNRIERGEQLAADREARAQEKEQMRLWQEQQNALYKRTLEQQIALKSAPTIHISNSGGSSSRGGNDFAGAAPVIGVDPRTEQPVYRHTKSGNLFRYDETGNAIPHDGAIGPKPTAPTASATKAIHEANLGMQGIDDAIAEIDKPAAKGAMGLVNAIPGAETVRQYTNPEGIPARAAVANIGSLKLHDRSGAAVTVSEFPRLRPFIPTASDTPQAAKAKLGKLRDEYARMRAEWDGASKPKPAPVQQPTRRKYNPTTGDFE